MIKVCNEKELTPALQKKAEDLFAACAAYEGLTLSAPDLIAPEERVYLYLDDEDPSRLNAFLVTYDNGDYYEMTAFTRPECRQKGYFTKLFDRLISEIGEEAALCIYTDSARRPRSASTRTAAAMTPLPRWSSSSARSIPRRST